MELKIIDRGRGPEIAGTRITVYDVMDYYKLNWSPSSIAFMFRLRREQIEWAIQYIDAHKEEVTAEYSPMLERDAQGNSPEIQAKIDDSHRKLEKWLEERKKARAVETGHEGNSSGH